jgi:hypothetical protein
MIASWFVYVAIVIRVIGGFDYFRSVLTGRSKPNPITWFIWGLTPMVAFAAQIHENVGIQAWVTFALGATPLMICVAALYKNRSRSHFTTFNVGCGLIAIVGVVLWQLTNEPLLAILFSILADIFGSIPTLVKSYCQPQTEYLTPYLLSMVSMALTLATFRSWHFTSYAFPAYILLINAAIGGAILLGHSKQRSRQQKRRSRGRPRKNR